MPTEMYELSVYPFLLFSCNSVTSTQNSAKVMWSDGKRSAVSQAQCTISYTAMKCIYNGTPLVRPPLLHRKSGLSREVASRQG